jgi:hypothetical protein
MPVSSVTVCLAQASVLALSLSMKSRSHTIRVDHVERTAMRPTMRDLVSVLADVCKLFSLGSLISNTPLHLFHSSRRKRLHNICTEAL